jgi:hypothetical protein
MRLHDGREIGQVACGMSNGKDGGHGSILLDATIRPAWNLMSGGGLPTNTKCIFCPEAAAEPIPSGPIWLLKKTQPNLRTSRDGNYQGVGTFSENTR